MKKILTIGFTTLTFYTQAQVADSSLRVVPLQGALNFRDEGGYQTTDGKTVKWGRVYRSAEISKLTDADMKLLAQKHINTVVDFRGTEEAAKAPDRLLPNADYILCPSGSQNLGGWMQTLMTVESGDSLMTSFYNKPDSLGARYKPFFAKLLQLPDTSAIVFHCTAGKDRTGIAGALFLYSLGVPKPTIMADYLASNIYRKPENEKMVKMMTQMKIKEAVAWDMASVKEPYLQATFDGIEAKYGSIDKFLKKEAGVGKKEKKALRKKFTN